MKDLFETPEKLPIEVQNVLNKFGEIETYDQCKAMLNELKPLGYTFEYYLDAQPFNLQKIKPTKVQFMYNKEQNDLFAFFPNNIEGTTPDKKRMYLCYSTVGQHSTCMIDYKKASKKATPEQYKYLKEELISIGYNLKIV